jgi:endonuclease III
MTNFADKVKRLERVRLALRRPYGDPPRLVVTHPVDHAMLAILWEETTFKKAQEALDRLHEEFVDLNDLRVSRPREIREALGQTFPRSGPKARLIPRLLDQVFKHHNSMVWDFLETMGKTDVRAFFEKMDEVRPFVAAVIARDCAGAHAFPVDNDVARVLGRLAVLDPGTQTEIDMQALLERAVKANRAYETYWLVKRLGEDVCLAGTPLCADCPLNSMCPSAVCPPRGKGKKAPAAKAPEAKAPAKAAVKAPAAKAAPKAKAAKAAKPAAKPAAKKKAPASKKGR